MHVSFIPYGHRQWLEWALREMEAMKFPATLWKKDKRVKGGVKKKWVWLQGCIRILPGGIYEYVFPKEGRDYVLKTLNFDDKAPYIGKTKIAIIRKAIGHKKVKPFNESAKKLNWKLHHVSFVPIGELYDSEITDSSGENKGWTHEAI